MSSFREMIFIRQSTLCPWQGKRITRCQSLIFHWGFFLRAFDDPLYLFMYHSITSIPGNHLLAVRDESPKVYPKCSPRTRVKRSRCTAIRKHALSTGTRPPAWSRTSCDISSLNHCLPVGLPASFLPYYTLLCPQQPE